MVFALVAVFALVVVFALVTAFALVAVLLFFDLGTGLALVAFLVVFPAFLAVGFLVLVVDFLVIVFLVTQYTPFCKVAVKIVRLGIIYYISPMSLSSKNFTDKQRLDRATALRVLCADMVEAAASGHPGAPLGMADIAEVLWGDFLKHDPAHPQWPNRDRFVLSNGHASALLYSLLHLTGYPLTIDELKRFRQHGSATPGHPEYGCTPGVETTTGPLGQGLATAVGMAIAEKTLSAQFNQPDCSVIDHYTYCFVGDGDLMEGISHEASALAATLELGKLIVLYDSNGISIDGQVENWMSEDVAGRYRAYGWKVIGPIDGHQPAELIAALTDARKTSEEPCIIIANTVIGHGAPTKAGNKSVHGSPLGKDELGHMKQTLQWEHPPFVVPPATYQLWDAKKSGAQAFAQWEETRRAYQTKYPTQYAELLRRESGEMPASYREVVEQSLLRIHQDAEKLATRKSASQALNMLAPHLPELLGGSADLTSSNLTDHKGSIPLHQSSKGNYIHYGVREFSMVAIMNGIALHGGFIPYGGTFLVFSDYARNAIRLAAMMQLKTIFVLTHDSIGLGEDGPTHQPIEHLWSLRLIPQLQVWRPADSFEATAAYHASLSHQGPSVLSLSRQGCAYTQEGDISPTDRLTKVLNGGYTLREAQDPRLILIATGSEVALALELYHSLQKSGVSVRLVSLPCVSRFLASAQSYQQSVIPDTVEKRVVIEAGVSLPWQGVFGTGALVCGVDHFGLSAPASDCYDHVGLTHDTLLAKIQEYIS